MMTTMKQCSRCKQEFPATREYFRAKKTGRYGLSGRCKSCQKEDDINLQKPPLQDANTFIQCKQCLELKPATTDFFYASKSGHLGLKSRCKKCVQQTGISPTNDPTITKECTLCKKSHPATTEFFYSHRHAHLGLHPFCKYCFREYQHKHKKASDPINDPSISKTCTHCGMTHPATTEYFKAHKYGRFGLGAWCKFCTRDYDRQYRLDHLEERLAKDKEYKAKHRNRIREVNREYYLNHIYEVRIMQREYRQNNRIAVQAGIQRWRTENRMHVIILEQRRRARIRNLPNTLTNTQWEYAVTYWEHCCAYCGVMPSRLSLDHFIPISDSNCLGTSFENVLPACLSCNSGKRDRNALDWLINKFGREEAENILGEIFLYFSLIKELPM